MRWAVGASGARILDRLVRISRDLTGEYAAAFWRQRAERNMGHVLKEVLFNLRQGRWSVLRDMLARVRPHHLRMVAAWAASRVTPRSWLPLGLPQKPKPSGWSQWG